MRVILLKWMFAKQLLPFKGKNGIYFGTEFFLILKNIELLGSLGHENVRQILSRGWQENLVSLCSHTVWALHPQL